MSEKIVLPDKKVLMFSRFSEIGELRALPPTDTTGYIIEGYAIVYEQRANIGNWFYEIIKQGALDEADLTDVPFFIHHNQNKIPLARSRRNKGSSTMKLTPDNKGLHFRAELDVENNMEARALYSAVEREDITGMSYSFLIKEEKWLDKDKPMPTREIYKFKKIGEISALWSPAYTGTIIEARAGELDSSDKLALDNARATLDSEKNELELLKLKIKIKGEM
jgi:HK97 family phage prohead protease